MLYRSLLITCLGLACLLSNAATMAQDARTTADPDVPTEELKLLLTPLTKDELLIEAAAWQKIVQQHASAVAEEEIQVIRDNRLLDAADNTDAAAGEDGPSLSEQAVETLEARKQALLEHQAELREQRTLALDNMRVVVEELRAKTDPNDSETMATVTDFGLYIASVSGIHLDVTDTTSAWVTLKTWALSKQGGRRWAMNFLKFAGLVLLAYLLARLLGMVMRLVARQMALPMLLSQFLVVFAQWVTIVIGVIWSLSVFELSIAPLLAMLGAAGFAIAFALQDSLSNVASGLMILFFRPFDMGDIVEAGGVSGTVHSMNIVSTTIKTFDNKEMVVPNAKIWSDVITNATNVTQRRVDLEFGIGYRDDVDRAMQVLEEIVRAHDLVLEDPAPTIRLARLADSSVNLICRPWTTPENYWEVYWDITREVKRRFDQEGIGIPFPQRDVHLYIEGDAAEAARALSGRADKGPTQTPRAPNEPAHDDGGLDRPDDDKEPVNN